jgi:hypothetical protein
MYLNAQPAKFRAGSEALQVGSFDFSRFSKYVCALLPPSAHFVVSLGTENVPK